MPRQLQIKIIYINILLTLGRRGERCVSILVESLEKGDRFRNLGLYEKVILKLT